MAPKKAMAKSPKPKSTPARRAKPEVVEVSSHASSNYDDVPDPDVEVAKDDLGSAVDSGPEPEAATPARKGGKRKAADDDDDGEESPGAKKAKVSSSSINFTKSVTESGGRKHAHRNVKVEIPVSTATPVTKPAGKHIVFNDDEGPAEFFTPQEAPAQELLDAQLSEAGRGGGADAGEEEEDEGSDSDDDAPEAVSSHAAAAQAAKSAQAATKAAEKQSELQKRKRQERDARLKQQAETRKKNQAVSDKKAAAAAKVSPEPGRRDHLPSVSTAPTRRRLDKRALPDVLPDDFLQAASDEEDNSDQDDEQDDAARKPKKVKFDTVMEQVAKAESRRPKDQRVGSTVYRVAAPQRDPRLAPKLNKNSRNAREMLLLRHRPVAKKGGFLVKKRR